MGRLALSVKEAWNLGKPLIESLEPLCFGDTLGEGQGQAEPGRDKMRKRCRSKKFEYSDIISHTKNPPEQQLHAIGAQRKAREKNRDDGKQTNTRCGEIIFLDRKIMNQLGEQKK